MKRGKNIQYPGYTKENKRSIKYIYSLVYKGILGKMYVAKVEVTFEIKDFYFPKKLPFSKDQFSALNRTALDISSL